VLRNEQYDADEYGNGDDRPPEGMSRENAYEKDEKIEYGPVKNFGEKISKGSPFGEFDVGDGILSSDEELERVFSGDFEKAGKRRQIEIFRFAGL
jgi:hypothetical protein